MHLLLSWRDPPQSLWRGGVPNRRALCIVAGPTSEPVAGELDKLDAYLNGGGSMLVEVDPPPSASLKDFLKKWSVDPGDNVVLDFSGFGQLIGAGPQIPVVLKYETHRIT